MKTSNTWWGVVFACAWLAGCGGGGGGGTTAGDTPAPAPTADEPTLALANQSAPYAALTLSAASQLQNLAQLTVDLSQRLSRAGVPNPLAIQCPVNGNLTLSLLDRDNNGRASAGDRITAVFDHCSLPLLQLSATGTAVVELQTGGAAGLDNEVRAQLQVIDALQLEKTGYRAFLGDWTPMAVRGSLAVTWTAGETNTRLAIKSTTADDLRFDANPVRGNPPIELRKIDTVKDVRFDDARIVHALGFQLMVGTGRAVVQPTPALTLDLGGTVRSGRVTVLAAGGQSLQISGPGTFGFAWTVDTLAANGSTLDARSLSADVDQGTLGWDGRHTVTTSYGPGYSAGAYVEGPVNTVYDQTPANVTGTDRLFLHPQLRPSADDAELVLRVQARARYAVPPAGFQWRLRDLATGSDEAAPAWNVPARATVHGALIKVVATERLRYGQRYSLEASRDGVDWTTTHELALDDGSVQRLGPGLSNVEMRSTLLVAPPRFQRAVVSAQQATLLSPTATTADGATVVRWQWTQLDGPPVVLDRPDQRETWARLPADGPRAFGKSTFEISAADSLGRTQRARVILNSGNTAATGALHYVESRNDARQERFVALEGDSSTALIRGFYPFPADAYELRASSGPGQSISQMLRMPDGLPLAVGRYDAMLTLPISPGMAWLGCGAVSDCAYGTSGRFEVLEVETTPDGTVRRLAIDYDLPTSPTVAEWALRGSFRFNSSMPVRP